MGYYFKMAWRNIWRNKRRTFITAASIFFAVFFAIVMRSVQLGSYANMTDNVVQAYTGYIQIFDHRYQQDKTIDHSITADSGLLSGISSHPNVTGAVPRLESFALASSGNQTKGVLVVGPEPEKENGLTRLADKVVKGAYLKAGDPGVLLSRRLAAFLKCTVGDTVVLISQGYHGIGAADQFPVRGIIHFPSPDLDNKMIFMNLNFCQNFFSAPGQITSISLNLAKEKKMAGTVKDLQKQLGPDYDVKSWKKILTQLVQQIESDNIGGQILLGLLYLIVGFGVFGTVQMMTTERRKEFGVMIAVGMQKIRLARVLVMEMIFIGALGVLSGVIFSVPVVYFLHIHPITLTGEGAKMIISYGMEPLMPGAWEAGYFFSQAGIVLCIVIVAVFFPIFWVTRLKSNEALRT